MSHWLLRESFEDTVINFDALEGGKRETAAAEIMNKLVALLHVPLVLHYDTQLVPIDTSRVYLKVRLSKSWV